MAIALFNASILSVPLHGLAHWLAGMAQAKSNLFRRQAWIAPERWRQPETVGGLVVGSGGRLAGGDNPVRPVRPLRVLRVVDSWHTPANAGRMVISGRMADVCAELERLAESDTTRP